MNHLEAEIKHFLIKHQTDQTFFALGFFTVRWMAGNHLLFCCLFCCWFVSLFMTCKTRHPLTFWNVLFSRWNSFPGFIPKCDIFHFNNKKGKRHVYSLFVTKSHDNHAWQHSWCNMVDGDNKKTKSMATRTLKNVKWWWTRSSYQLSLYGVKKEMVIRLWKWKRCSAAELIGRSLLGIYHDRYFQTSLTIASMGTFQHQSQWKAFRIFFSVTSL